MKRNANRIDKGVVFVYHASEVMLVAHDRRWSTLKSPKLLLLVILASFLSAGCMGVPRPIKPDNPPAGGDVPLMGYVYIGDPKLPASNAVVWVGSKKFTTNEEGIFEAKGVEPGPHTVYAETVLGMSPYDMFQFERGTILEIGVPWPNGFPTDTFLQAFCIEECMAPFGEPETIGTARWKEGSTIYYVFDGTDAGERDGKKVSVENKHFEKAQQALNKIMESRIVKDGILHIEVAPGATIAEKVKNANLIIRWGPVGGDDRATWGTVPDNRNNPLPPLGPIIIGGEIEQFTIVISNKKEHMDSNLAYEQGIFQAFGGWYQKDDKTSVSYLPTQEEFSRLSNTQKSQYYNKKMTTKDIWMLEALYAFPPNTKLK